MRGKELAMPRNKRKPRPEHEVEPSTPRPVIFPGPEKDFPARDLLESVAPRSPLDTARDQLRRVNDAISAAHEPIIRGFQQDLLALEGQSCDSFEANQRVAAAIQDTADRLR